MIVAQHESERVNRAPVAGEPPFQMHRLGVIMRPQATDPLECGGVLNPGGVRGPTGDYLLFPRLVAAGNYSRIGLARVTYDDARVPTGVERLGVALEPSEPYELNHWTGGGCEDARVVRVEALGVYVMTYTAFGPSGPRTAMAVSRDLDSWTRLGLVEYGPYQGTNMNVYTNKDHLLFPEPVEGPDGRPAIAMLHRAMYEIWAGDDIAHHNRFVPPPAGIVDRRWAIWIAYCPLDQADWANPKPGATPPTPRFGNHHVLIGPRKRWEALRIGAGTPPIRLPDGWLMIYHGVQAMPRYGLRSAWRYVAAALLMDGSDPRRILYRSPEPILEPALPEENFGVVANVVFPTAVDHYETYLDIYYGMADAQIGAARMSIPTSLPTAATGRLTLP